VNITGMPAWTVVIAAVILGCTAAAAAALDGYLDPATHDQRLGVRLGRPIWETSRLLLQRHRTTPAADLLLWRAGTNAPLVVALLKVVVVPLGAWVVSDLPVGIVWFNTMDVVLWVAFWLAGWGPNSAHGLIGAYRYMAQALAYELPLMFAFIAPATAASSLRIGDVIEAQQELWFVVTMPVAAVVFLAGIVAFSAWGPFSYPLGADAAGGVLAESSGVDRLMLLAGRYALLVVGAAMAVALFLGGGSGPLLPPWAWTAIKTLAVAAGLVAVRRRLPVLPADRVMKIAWLVVLPATLAQVLFVSLYTVWKG